MRGDDRPPKDLFTDSGPEQQVPADSPLRHIRDMVDTVWRTSQEFAPAVCEDGPAGDPAGEAAPRALVVQPGGFRNLTWAGATP